MIRAKDIIESVKNIVMNERNVINTDEIDDFVVKISQRNHVRDKQIHQWLQTTLRKYLINDYPSVGQATDGFIQSRPEYQAPWVDQALERGEKLYKVYLGGGLPQSIDHVIDYLTQAMDPPDDFPPDLKIRDLTRLSVQDAVDKSNDWTEWLNNRDMRGDVAAGEKEIVKLSGGYRAVQLTSAAALDLEGKSMQHCVGSYAHELTQGTEIYSLRDSSNNPHVTFEIKDKGVKQIKGKQNQPPVERYRKPCIEFLNYMIEENLIRPYEIRELEAIDAGIYQGIVVSSEDAPGEIEASKQLAKIKDFKGQDRKVKSLLDRGADPNTAYYLLRARQVERAASQGEREIARLMIDYGAETDYLVSRLPFYCAMGDLLAVKSVLDILPHFDLNARTDHEVMRGTTPLTATCHIIKSDLEKSGRVETCLKIIDCLLDAGADIDATGTGGYTPLDCAFLASGNREVVEFLLRAGADLDKTKAGLGGLDILNMSERDYDDLIQRLHDECGPYFR
jgi:hypothetical protein